MIGYVTLGTNKKDEAVKFYDELLKEIGIGRLMETDQYVAYGKDMNSPGIGVTLPFDGKPATVGNGTMVALQMENTNQVDRLYKKALELGGTDEGAPGPRGESGFYAGYFRDLDGNKLNVFSFVKT